MTEYEEKNEEENEKKGSFETYHSQFLINLFFYLNYDGFDKFIENTYL